MSQSLLVPAVIAMLALMAGGCVSRRLAARATPGGPAARYEAVQTLCASATLLCGGLYMLAYIYEHAA